MKRVGIFAGSFDPIHEGHIAFAKQATSECKLDKVFFLVEPRPRRKQGVKALEHRAKMVQLAVRKEPRMGSIMLEQTRFTTTETLPILKARFKGADLFLLFGDDVLKHLADWPHVDELLGGVSFIIGVRKSPITKIRTTIRTIEKTRGIKINYTVFKSTTPDVSSTQIRLSLKCGNQPTGLPGSVEAYIKTHHLYAPLID